MRAAGWASSLASGDVIVVSFSLEATADREAMTSVLDPAERARAERFVREADRARFVAAHAFTRAVLGACLGVPARSLVFGAGPFGKPHLLEPASAIEFNLSHTVGRGLLAVSHGRDVGVDIEQIRPVDALGLAVRSFSPREREALAAFPEQERVHAFYRGWTRKESFVKAHGAGLSFPLQQFDVSLEDLDGNLLLDAGTAAVGQAWTVRALTVPTGFCAALTAAGFLGRVVPYELSWEGFPPD